MVQGLNGEAVARLRLARTAQVGPVTYRQLLRRFGSAGAALEALPELARRGGRAAPLAPPPLRQIEDEIKAVEKRGGTFLFLGTPDYPEALAAIEDAPPALTVFGHAPLLHKKTVGIVGARNASLNGRKMAERLAADVGAEGIVVASGLARGIDTAAHVQSLKTGTVAVLAGGADVVYPEENRALYDKIVEAGCVVSDQPLGMEPKAQLFPRRNRIISGLSLGVVVVEAALKSGSLITARMALEQGRDVFAVPGSPLDPRAAGTNRLLREGAILVERGADILEHVNRPPSRLAEPSGPPIELALAPISEDILARGREKIVEFLGPSPIEVDELVRACQLSLPVVLTVLLELELAGRLERQPGQKVALVG